VEGNVKQLLSQGDSLFNKRQPLLTQWQCIADQFYVERADFTASLCIGEDYARHLNDSYPLIIRRELGDFLSTLRRKDQEWFEATIEREDRLDDAGRKWLERATKIQRRAMYDRRSQFTRALKEADHDYVTFGQAVLTVEANHATNTLLYQTWHLRDCVWRFTSDGRLAEVQRKWLPTARQLDTQFKGKGSMHENVTKMLSKDGQAEIECRHIVISVDEYEPKKRIRGQTHCELYVDVANCHLIYEAPLKNAKYVIPRWKTISGSQYAHSPAVTVGLPDARLIQAMSLTLLEAGEMAIRPPLAAKDDAITSLKWYSGGVTSIDASYDGRIEDAIRPIVTSDKSALPFGLDFLQAKQQMLAQAFYINKINLPQFDHEMTAYEFSQRLQEYIRTVLPLFEPIDSEYHSHVCDMTFQVLMDENAFGPPQEFPRSVQNDEAVFRFDSPMSEAVERQKGQQFLEAKGLVQQAMEMDPGCGAMIDFRIGLREAIAGKRIPAKWTRDEEAVEAHAQQITQAQQAQQQLQQLQMAGQAGQDLGKAGKELEGVL
jgi:hypothetical protein